MIITELQLFGLLITFFGASLVVHGKVEFEAGVGHGEGRRFRFLKLSKSSAMGLPVKVFGAALSLVGLYFLFFVPGGEIIINF